MSLSAPRSWVALLGLMRVDTWTLVEVVLALVAAYWCCPSLVPRCLVASCILFGQVEAGSFVVYHHLHHFGRMMCDYGEVANWTLSHWHLWLLHRASMLPSTVSSQQQSNQWL
jgi:hypothetical protein